MKQETQSATTYWAAAFREFLTGLVVFVALLLPFEQVAWADSGLPLVFQRDAQASAELSFGVQLALLETTAKLAQEWGDKSESVGGATHSDGRVSLPEAGVAYQTAEVPRVNSNQPIGPDPGKGFVRLPGHVLDALARATPVEPEGVFPLSPAASAAQQQVTLTLVFKRDDQAGFDRYMKDVYDPKSKRYRHFLTQAQIAKRFGPSHRGYMEVLGYLRAKGFRLVEGSKNRMTLTVRSTRAKAELAFSLHIKDYKIGDRSFYANESDPALPVSLASRVQAISGLSNAAKQERAKEAFQGACNAAHALDLLVLIPLAVFALEAIIGFLVSATFCFMFENILTALDATPGSGYKDPFGPYNPFSSNFGKFGNASRRISPSPKTQTTATLPGTGQTIGLLEFDTFNSSDIDDYINLVNETGGSVGQIGNVTEVPVNGGVSVPGAGEGEVLLDIDTVMTIAPGANVVVYDAPFDGHAASYSALFNAMINGGVTIISNSWASCEDQATLADVQGIDTVLQSAAAGGISVFNGTGDGGSTCLDGSPNTISVPADSPNATAVGGTSLTMGPGYTYGSETWWNGTNATPPTGQGGFGVSKFFTRPSYQDGNNSAAMRSIPDVAVTADPSNGAVICQADDGGCPSGLLNGGTSMAAPIWAAFTALLNGVRTQNLGALNPLIYPFANTKSFHSGTSMGSDFAHVGLGSPNLNILNLSLENGVAGLPDAGASETAALFQSGTVLQQNGGPNVPADGLSKGGVIVRLLDANGNTVSGKTVTLSASGGSSTITPSSAVTTADNGASVFTITDLKPETISYTAIDTTDGITLTQTAAVTFGVPPAASGSISALTPTDTADGATPDTIIVTLQDSLGRPTPGKQITLMQSGSSLFTGPTPGVTDSNGQIKFTVTDLANESVAYTAVDVTDGNLPVPGSTQVAFSNGATGGCPGGSVPSTAAYTISAFATGIPTEISNYSGVYLPCRGADGMAFDASGNLYVADDNTGNIYKFPPSGGVAGSGTLLTKTPLNPGVAGLAFGKDGELYATQVATTGNVYTGAVVQIDTTTGAVVRTVVAGGGDAGDLTCAWGLATDPISGDLFVDDGCIGGGADSPDVWRISNPASSNPTVSVYATMATSGNFDMAFAPDGTLYVTESNGCCGNEFINVTEIGGTSTPSPARVNVLPGVTTFNSGYVAIGTRSGGGAQLLVAGGPAYGDGGGFGGGLIEYDLTTSPPSQIAVLVPNLYLLNVVQGPDGCIYTAVFDHIAKVTNADGTCPLAGTTGAPTLVLTPPTAPSNPTQGSSQTFTATPHFGNIPAGTPVFFTVTGANPQVKLVDANASGQAVLTYTAVNAGTDTVVATTTLSGSSSSSGSSSGASTTATTLTSNQARVTWNTGPHTSFLTLNPSPTGGTVNVPVTVIASLTDVSENPATALGGGVVNFTLGGASCTGTTDAKGLASCSLTPSQGGMNRLTATFNGAPAFNPATASSSFSVFASAPPTETTVTITVNPAAITLGGSAALNWSSSNATSCSASGAWSGSEPFSGSQTVSPAATGTDTYTLTCIGAGGSTSASAILTVNPPPSPPAVTIAVAPSSITLGGNATLSWSSSNAASCTASNAWSGDEPFSGSQTVSPAATGTDTYTLTCTGAGGSTSASTILTVNAPAAPTVNLTVNPASIILGSSATLSWSSAGATSCTASGAWSGSEQLSGSQTVSPAATGADTYTLTCSGAGGSGSSSTILTVNPPPTPMVTLTVSPTKITVGGSANLTWTSINATSCTASGAWSGSEPLSGSQSVSPATAGIDTYTLTCTGAGGSSNASATLTVSAVVLPPPPSVTIAVNPAAITQGQSAALSWSSTNAQACAASGAWSGAEPTGGTATVTPAAVASDTYTLACTGADGNTATASAVLTVNPVPLAPVSVKAGGGAAGPGFLGFLGLLAWIRRRRRHALRGFLLVPPLLGYTAAAVASSVDQAFGGVRIGAVESGFNSGFVTRQLQAQGYAVHVTGGGSAGVGETAYVGFSPAAHVDLMFSFTHTADVSAAISGSSPSNLGQFLRNTGGLLTGYGGDVYAASIGFYGDILPRLSLEPRAGILLVSTHTTLSSGSGSVDETHQRGGLTLGLSLDYRIWRGLSIGGAIDYYRAAEGTTFTLPAGEIKWRFGSRGA